MTHNVVAAALLGALALLVLVAEVEPTRWLVVPLVAPLVYAILVLLGVL